MPSVCPCVTCWPGETAMLERWAYSVSMPLGLSMITYRPYEQQAGAGAAGRADGRRGIDRWRRGDADGLLRGSVGRGSRNGGGGHRQGAVRDEDRLVLQHLIGRAEAVTGP